MPGTNPECRKTRAFQHCVDFATLVRYTSGVEHRMERRLATILAADVVGYSRLVGPELSYFSPKD
jgi:class 3 adenylate cyclase